MVAAVDLQTRHKEVARRRAFTPNSVARRAQAHQLAARFGQAWTALVAKNPGGARELGGVEVTTQVGTIILITLENVRRMAVAQPDLIQQVLAHMERRASMK